MILTVTRDLIFSRKISEICKRNGHNAKTVRDLPTLEQALNDAELVVFDLNARDLDVFEAIRLCVEHKMPTLAFFSHVDEELKTKAHTLGVEKVVARSSFEKELSQILGEFTKIAPVQENKLPNGDVN